MSGSRTVSARQKFICANGMIADWFNPAITSRVTPVLALTNECDQKPLSSYGLRFNRPVSPEDSRNYTVMVVEGNCNLPRVTSDPITFFVPNDHPATKDRSLLSRVLHIGQKSQSESAPISRKRDPRVQQLVTNGVSKSASGLTQRIADPPPVEGDGEILDLQCQQNKRTDEGLPMPSTVVETAVNDGLVSGDMDDQVLGYTRLSVGYSRKQEFEQDSSISTIFVPRMVSTEYSRADSEQDGSPPAVFVHGMNHEFTIPDCGCQRNRRRAHNKLVSDKLSLGTTVKESVGEMSVAELASEKTAQFSSGLHPLLSSTMTMISKMQCTSSGAAVHSEDHDIHVNIPEGAIPPGETLSIEVGVALFGPFVFPEGTVPVSPIVWLCVTSADQQNYQFLNPVEITLPHCLDPSSGSSSSHHLHFLKANHTFSGEGDGFYSMLPTDGTAVFHHDKALGTLYTDHFCSFCIAERITEDEATAANFCMIMASPKRPQPPYDVYFGVMFYLATCIKTFKDQLPGYEYSEQQFKFEDSESLRITFDGKVGGWHFCLRSGSLQILLDDIQFWKLPEQLKLKEELERYPPRFWVEVYGSDIDSKTVRFAFSGADRELCFDHFLQHPDRTRPKSSACNTVQDETFGMLVDLPRRDATQWQKKANSLIDDMGVPPGIADHGCADEHLWELSRHIRDWKTIVGFLGFENAQVAQKRIETEHPWDLYQQTVQMFLEWREYWGRRCATYRRLIEVFVRLQKMTYAEKLCELVCRPPLDDHHTCSGSQRSSGAESLALALSPSLSSLSSDSGMYGSSPPLEDERHRRKRGRLSDI